ncbi:hypothetical protein SprV_0200621700 [Sparganum proliferum]
MVYEKERWIKGFPSKVDSAPETSDDDNDDDDYDDDDDDEEEEEEEEEEEGEEEEEEEGEEEKRGRIEQTNEVQPVVDIPHYPPA